MDAFWYVKFFVVFSCLHYKKRRLAGIGSFGRSGGLFLSRVRVQDLLVAAEPFASVI